MSSRSQCRQTKQVVIARTAAAPKQASCRRDKPRKNFSRYSVISKFVFVAIIRIYPIALVMAFVNLPLIKTATSRITDGPSMAHACSVMLPPLPSEDASAG